MRTFCLKKPVDKDSLAALRAAIAVSIEAGESEIAVDIDDLGILESNVISALLVIRRQVSDRGAALSLRASRPRLLESLRITALDRLFSVVASDGGCARSKFVAAFVAAAFALGTLLGSRASAAEDTSPQDLIRNVIAQNADMRSYEAHVNVDLHVRSFPYVSQRLTGTTYFKRPDSFEVVFDKVPSYAKGFDKLYSDIDDPTGWSKRFDLSLAGERIVAGHRDYVVRLVQKVRGMIDHEEVAIDPATWHIDSMAWYYYNGGTIAMDQSYQRVGSFDVLARQHATIRIPFVHAAADATYDGYKTNVAIDDAVFSHGDNR